MCGLNQNIQAGETMIEDTMGLLIRTLTVTSIALALGDPAVPSPHAASIVETVEGFNISDTEDAANSRPCNMVRSYNDTKDPAFGKALFFAQLEGGKIIANMVFTKWSWGVGNTPKVRFQVDNQ